MNKAMVNINTQGSAFGTLLEMRHLSVQDGGPRFANPEHRVLVELQQVVVVYGELIGIPSLLVMKIVFTVTIVESIGDSIQSGNCSHLQSQSC